jgi:hypothetical protein
MCNACGNVCCGSDQFGGCGCDGCTCPECWSDEPEDECIHEEYEADILTGIASCDMCGHRWTLTDRQIEAESERIAAYEKEEAYWNRVDEGRQRAKDGER